MAFYFATYLKVYRDIAPETVHILMLWNYVVVALMSVGFGIASDKIGIRKVYLAIFPFICVSIILVNKLISTGNLIEIILAQVILAFCVGGSLGPKPTFLYLLYPDKIRSTGISISYSLSTVIFGGATPMIFQYFVNYCCGELVYCNYYIILFSILGFLVVFTSDIGKTRSSDSKMKPSLQ